MNSPIQSDDRLFALPPLLPWEVRKVRGQLAEVESEPQPKSAKGRAIFANIARACRAALAEYEASSPLARLRRSRKRFEAAMEYRVSLEEQAYLDEEEQIEWPPSVAIVAGVLEELAQPRQESDKAMTPLQAAVMGALVDHQGGTVGEITAKLSTDYPRPPTRESVTHVYESRRAR